MEVQTKQIEQLRAKLLAAETLCEELMDENEDMKKELRDLEEEIEEMQDNFRYLYILYLKYLCYDGHYYLFIILIRFESIALYIIIFFFIDFKFTEKIKRMNILH